MPRAALQIIADAERHDPGAGPFRIHRMPDWHPEAMLRRGSPRRQRELVAWERDTLRPGYGSAYGLDYTLTVGVLELDDYLRFYQPRPALLAAHDAGVLGVPPGQVILAYPRAPSTSGTRGTSSSRPVPSTGRTTAGALPRS